MKLRVRLTEGDAVSESEAETMAKTKTETAADVSIMTSSHSSFQFCSLPRLR